jgi:STE24 endopeptidase
VPVVLALAVLGSFLALPVQDTVSRSVEARADASALALTHDPATFIAVQQQLALSNLDHLDPNPVLAFWFNNHPTPLDRIEMALQWSQLHPDLARRSRTSP